MLFEHSMSSSFFFLLYPAGVSGRDFYLTRFFFLYPAGVSGRVLSYSLTNASLSCYYNGIRSPNGCVLFPYRIRQGLSYSFFILPASVLRTDVSWCVLFPYRVLMCPVSLPFFLSFFLYTSVLRTDVFCFPTVFFLSFFCQQFKSQWLKISILDLPWAMIVGLMSSGYIGLIGLSPCKPSELIYHDNNWCMV